MYALEFGELRDREQVVATLSEKPSCFDECLACEQQSGELLEQPHRSRLMREREGFRRGEL
jgi:hypothetical protein